MQKREEEREKDSVESSFKKLATTDNKNLNKNPVNICKKIKIMTKKKNKKRNKIVVSK